MKQGRNRGNGARKRDLEGSRFKRLLFSVSAAKSVGEVEAHGDHAIASDSAVDGPKVGYVVGATAAPNRVDTLNAGANSADTSADIELRENF